MNRRSLSLVSERESLASVQGVLPTTSPGRPRRGSAPVKEALQAHPVIGGAVIGLLWGVSMRLWMRFIATDPEFSLAGTGFILGASVIVGVILGFAHHRRLVGGAGWFRSSVLALALLGAGGAVMWPTVILWSVAWGQRRRRWMLVLLGIAGVAAQLSVINDAVIDNSKLGLVGSAVAVAWYLPMLVGEAWAFSVASSPGLADPAPSRRKQAFMVALAGLPMIAMAGLVAGAG